MLYKKFARLTFPKNAHTLNTRIYFCDSRTLVRSGLLSESISSGFGQETASEKEFVLQPLVRIDLFEA